jgi:formate-dependent phosphoribosylglycinamide formyltransferase (GAR transformylase)
VLARPAVAAPAGGERVAVVSVAVAAELEPERAAIEEALGARLETAGLLVVPPAESRRLTAGREALLACTADRPVCSSWRAR